MMALRRTTDRIGRKLWLKRNHRAFADNGPRRRPRLLVDISVIMRRDAGTGIQRVVRSVWSHLASVNSANFDVVPVYAGSRHGYCFAPDDFLDRDAEPTTVAVGVKPGDKFFGLDLAAHYLPACAKQLAAWRKNGATVHVVVYDLLPLTRPDWFQAGTSRNFERWISVLKKHCDQVLCISNRVADEFRSRILGNGDARGLQVGRLYLSGDIAGSVPSIGCSPESHSLLKAAQSRTSVLMVGTVEPRKAYDRAIAAFERLWASDPERPVDLIIVGQPGWKTVALQQYLREHPENGKRLHWLQNISDEALTQFYEASRVVFHASYDEGFGLPVVEAATHRRWALVRDLSVFREQGLPNLRYFTDDSPENLAADLAAVLGTAEASSPAPADCPDWSWCVDRLLEEIGFAESASVRHPPRLRVVS